MPMTCGDRPRQRICELDGCSRAFIATRPWHLFCSRECARSDLERLKLNAYRLVVTADGQLRLEEPSPEEQAAGRKRLMAQVRSYVSRLKRMPPRRAYEKLLRDMGSEEDRAVRALIALVHLWDDAPLE